MENKKLQSSPSAEATDFLISIRSEYNAKALVEVYNGWTHYDENMVDISYTGPNQAAAGVASHLPDQKDVSILDVGAGTGLVAEELKKLGFTNIDGLDPSEGMITSAREKQIYKKYFVVPFTDNVECIETGSYDVLVTCGSFEGGHMLGNVFPEMIRCVKTGGLVVLVFNNSMRTKFPSVIQSIEELEAEGKWHCLEKYTFAGYTNEAIGERYVMRITTTT